MRLRLPSDQADNARSYLEEHGYQIQLTKTKTNGDILILAKRTGYIFNRHHWIQSEQDEYLYIRDKFRGRAKMICLESIPEAK